MKTSQKQTSYPHSNRFHSFSSHHPCRLLSVFQTPTSNIMNLRLTFYNSEFPSLSNNPQLGNAGQSNLWTTGGRNIGAQIPRNQGTSISSQPSQQQQDDLFSASSRLSSAQGAFRFGNPPAAAQPSLSQSTPADDFPPLNRNANGDIGQERGTSLMSTFGFGASSAAPAPASQRSNPAAGNALLNALVNNSRGAEALSPTIGELN